jgi:CheY-like chemotaxis protein
MKKIILIVEDFEDTRIFMRFVLERLGYEVLEAPDGCKAIEIFNQITPDLIIMDMALPLMDGLTATKIIRQSHEAFQLPIIAFTASGEFISKQALAAGCNDLVTKPLDGSQLQAMVEKYLPR